MNAWLRRHLRRRPKQDDAETPTEDLAGTRAHDRGPRAPADAGRPPAPGDQRHGRTVRELGIAGAVLRAVERRAAGRRVRRA
ncbi:hypothetical protein, partial [Actinoallomurus acaciae]